MIKNYLIYPCKTMRITQGYYGKTSHLTHTTGEPVDYPIDEGCRDTGRNYFYCPCDEVVVKRIYGVGTRGTNTLWLESTGKVDFADGTKDCFSMLIIHPDDSDLNKIKVGQTFRRKEKICREGKDGATAFHFHFSGGKNRIKGNGWVKNSNGSYVLAVKGETEKPENLFYIDRNFTTVKDTKDIPFRYLPEYSKGRYEVKSKTLIIREGPSTKYEKVLYENFTKSDKLRLKKIKGDNYKESNYVKGTVFSCEKIHCNWGKCPSGWVCLDYCRRIDL